MSKTQKLYIGSAIQNLTNHGAIIKVSQADYDLINTPQLKEAFSDDGRRRSFRVKDLFSGRTVTIRHGKCGLCDREHCALRFVGPRPPIKNERVLKAA